MRYLININQLPNLQNKILYFYSRSLAYHDKYQNMILKIESEYDLKFFAINIVSDPSLIKRFKLKSTPSFVVYRDGKEVENFYGLLSLKDFKKKLSIQKTD